MYANDTSIYCSSKSVSSIRSAVNKDLQSLESWLDENKLSLNVAKHKGFLIDSGCGIRAAEQPDNQNPSLHIGEEAVSVVAGIRYLGVRLGQLLNWDEHLVIVAKKFPAV